MARRGWATGETEERWIFLSFAVPLILIISVALALEWVTVWRWAQVQWQTGSFTAADPFSLWTFALVPALIGVACLLPFYPAEHPWSWRLLVVTAFSLMAAILRMGLEYAFWGRVIVSGPLVLECLVSFLIPFCSMAVAMYLAKSQVQAVAADRRLVELEFKARQDALERENAELKVRREVSALLHDRIQQRLVYAASRLQTEVIPLARRSRDQVGVDLLEEIIGDIDRLREDDVRQLSHSLFPLGADIGLHQAVGLVLGRVPASVRIDLDVTDRAQAFDTVLEPQWDVAHRALVAEILGESITNALKHGRAGRISVRLDLEGEGAERTLVLAVANDGIPVGPSPSLSGLSKHRVRAQLRGGGLTLGLNAEGQTSLTAWLPTTPADEQPPPDPEPAPAPRPEPSHDDAGAYDAAKTDGEAAPAVATA
ncbi:MAG: hypothetical protein LBL01_01100 [Bifidobacteriaceae bacterium]|nr:hypothetical protein [Bifidobacteriaceae bacterium]